MKKLVDLFTYERELESLILENYPYILKPEQHKIEDSEGRENKLYCFYDLDEKEIKNYLKNYKPHYEFELRNSKTGEIIEVNKIDYLEDFINLN